MIFKIIQSFKFQRIKMSRSQSRVHCSLFKKIQIHLTSQLYHLQFHLHIQTIKTELISEPFLVSLADFSATSAFKTLRHQEFRKTLKRGVS